MKNALKRMMPRPVKRALRGIMPGVGGDARPSDSIPSPSRALAWVRAAELETGGIRVCSGYPNAYPEVSGYLVPTLLHYGERELARRIVRWLTCIQRADGSYTDADRGDPYIFDTGQILRGLLAGRELVPRALDSARRAADYLRSRMVGDGRGGFGDAYEGTPYAAVKIPETVHLYVLPPLMEAAEVLGRDDYRRAAEACVAYYAGHEHLLKLSSLTHFLAYEIEALIDLGHPDRVATTLEAVRASQADDGAIPGVGGASWVCLPGQAQLAICWYKLCQWEPADKAVGWLERNQGASGGFLGSIGRGADYMPEQEPAWGVKFFLDAYQLRITSFLDRLAPAFPATIDGEDGRVRAILALVEPGDRVLEVGCGKGRYLARIRERCPDASCAGLDVSRVFLDYLPEGVRPLHGPMENIPGPDDQFDVVFSVEAIEHSPNPGAAVAEMVRVARPGGWVVIVDKQKAHWGRFDCPPWERWPEAAELKRLLGLSCDDVVAEPVSYVVPDGGASADGLMVLWRGRKRSRATGGLADHPAPSAKEMAERVRTNRVEEWEMVLHERTGPGESALGIGAGAGEAALQLARAGRAVTLCDDSADRLERSTACAEDLGVTLRAVRADATGALPFADGAFETVWQSGLLEHVTSGERRAILREWSRVAAGRIISLIPNASSVAYRAGRAGREATGAWLRGQEPPPTTLAPDFEAVGLRVVAEYSVGARAALRFLPERDPLRAALAAWIDATPRDVVGSCNQGRVLVTVAETSAPAPAAGGEGGRA